MKKFILGLVLAMTFGCAATVPKQSFDKAVSIANSCLTDLGESIKKTKQCEDELLKWRPSEEAQKEGKDAFDSIKPVIDQFMDIFRNEINEGMPGSVVKPDLVTFYDSYNAAVALVWVSTPSKMIKFYFYFNRNNAADLWMFSGFEPAGSVEVQTEQGLEEDNGEEL